MTDQHPITTPFEMVEEWARMLEYHRDEQVFNKIAQWGADQELEACATYIAINWKLSLLSDELICARRPKPPSLKEQALDALREAESSGCLYVNGRSDTIRRALEALPND